MPEGAPGDRSERPVPPLLADGACFDGLLVLHGAARIDGTIRGRVLGAEVLHIGEGGCVEARIDADEVIVAGRIVGDVTARDRVELRPTARVTGRLSAPRVAIAEGCEFDGPCSAGGGSGAARKQP